MAWIGKTLEHPSTRISSQVVIALPEKADRLPSGFSTITMLADRGFPGVELFGWLEGSSRWPYVVRLLADARSHATAALKGCEVRRLSLPRGHRRSFRDVASLRGDQHPSKKRCHGAPATVTHGMCSSMLIATNVRPCGSGASVNLDDIERAGAEAIELDSGA